MNLSDLHIDAVFPINVTFLIDNSSGYGISTHQFQILSGNDQMLFYYYPDDETCRSKDVFVRTLKKLIQGKIVKNESESSVDSALLFQNILKKIKATSLG